MTIISVIVGFAVSAALAAYVAHDNYGVLRTKSTIHNVETCIR